VVFDPLAPLTQLPENHRAVHTIRADITNRSWTGRVVDEILSQFGRIDVVVNAAAFRRWAPMLDGDVLISSLNRQFAVNVRAPLTVTLEVASRAWAGHAEENQAANRNVVNISSTAGIRVHTGYGQSVYAASKAALNSLTMHMAAELQPLGIRVNALAPDTFPDIVPTERVADSIVSLEESAATGRILVLDATGETWL
jgi:NAD(P)-dependent dehydrogenase (short-subunit alcohol dehydrogenase family)